MKKGDVDNDGFPDLLLGNPHAPLPASERTKWVSVWEAGEVWVFTSSKARNAQKELFRSNATLIIQAVWFHVEILY